MIKRTQQALAILGLCLITFGAAAQQKAGEITHLQGLATAGPPGGAVRFLAAGDPLLEGDVVTTTEKGYAIIALNDGTKFTLRPATSFALERFAHNAGEEALSMRLFKGGMRMITGLVGKRNPTGVEMKTATATVGIRGTSFDARLCGEDCRAEGMTPLVQMGANAPPPAPPVVARIVQVSGTATAALRGAAPRTLTGGAALYEGDDIKTSAGATAVIGFRDQTRVSVNPNTSMRIANYQYSQTQDDSKDSVALSLFKGGMRAFTGLIGKKHPEAFTVKTATATIGIRGTGMDVSCEGPCVDPSEAGTPPAGGPPPAGGAPDGGSPGQLDGLFLFTWEGGTYFVQGSFEVPLNQTGFIGRDGVARILITIPEFFNAFLAPRPDRVDINWENLFASAPPTGGDGLYIGVREGHVYILSGTSRIDLGIGEAGFLNALGIAQRLAYLPRFLTNDVYPLPDSVSQGNVPIFQLFGVTLGVPGQEMCRL